MQPMDPSAPAAPTDQRPPAPGGALRAAWQLAVPVLAMVLLTLALCAALVGGAYALLRSAQGTAWLLARLPGVELQGSEGALLSDRFAARRLVVRWDGGQQWVAIDDFVGAGLQWRWHPGPGKWLGLSASRLQARRVVVDTGPVGPRPIVMPRSLDLPLQLEAAQAAVDELQIDTLPMMRDARAVDVRLWAPGGEGYRARELRFDWERAQIRATGALGARAPFPLELQLSAQARGDGPPWTAQARTHGPLSAFAFDGTLRGTPATRTAPAPTLEMQATVMPLQAWALPRMRLLTQALDLQALSARAPRTALSGHVDLDSRSFSGPLAAVVELDNALPGRVDQGRAPVRHLRLRLRNPGEDRNHLQIEQFDIQFAAGNDTAGRWQGSGNWIGSRLQIETRIESLQPQQLDGRAPAMDLSGPLTIELQGLPAPDPQAPQATQATQAKPLPAPKRRSLALDLRAALEGRIQGSPLPVALTLDAGARLGAGPQHIAVRGLQLRAGSALATLALDLQGGSSGSTSRSSSWQLRTQGSLADFDPLPWWPGPEGSAWRRGGHRLFGDWALDLTLPGDALARAPLALAQAVTGSGRIDITRSQIAGVPLALQLELGQQAPAAAGASGRMKAQLQLGANRLVAEGQGNPLADGRDDRLQFELQAPQLAQLAPLAALWPDTAPWAPQSGTLQAQATLAGRWPDIRSAGSAQLQDLQAGSLSAQRLQASWDFDTASEQPLRLALTAERIAQGPQRLQQLQADLRGTWRQHRLELSAALPLQPGAALQNSLALQPGAGALLRLAADGQWAGDGRGGGRFAARAAQVTLLPWSGSGLAAAPAARPWIDARDLRFALRLSAEQGLQELQAEAGGMRLADTATLRWDQVLVDLRGAHPAFALRAQLEPFLLAPLLARLQPTLGWRGDLRLAAQVDLRVGEKVDADLLFERRDGDLHLAEEDNSIPFGLSEIRLIASAHDGDWQLAGAFAGRTLGEASARLNLRTPPDQRWPDSQTPIDGLVQGHVANIGIWGAWLPAGWRLSGDLRTSASVVGRLGAPEYAGEVRISQAAVRNLLLGVDVTQGDALLRLRGSNAEIEHFTLRGGEGSARISGRIDLAGQGTGELTLQAERLRVLGRIDRQLTASGRLTLDMPDSLPRLRGSVQVDEGLFDLSRSDAPTLDDDVVLRREGLASSNDPGTAAARPRRLVQVGVDIGLGDRLRVRGRGLDTTLSGHLAVGSNPAGRLTLSGTVNAAGGHYAAYGQKLDIARGLLIFSGEVENPTLDVLALRPDIDAQVGVAITGTLQSPRVRLYSDSDMSESDKLSWLVLGRASDGLDRADTALLQRAAIALLAGEGEAPTDTLLRNLGLDTLSLRQTGEGNVRETVVSLGKQLSRRWYVGYERGVNASTGTWQLIYRIAQRFTLRAQSGAENSLDLIWVWRLDNPPPLPAAATPAMPAAAPGSAGAARP